MELLLLGTGAADGIPALFGNDPVSEHARRAGGKEIRSRASALIDRQLKIDLPPEVLAQNERYGLSAADWKAVLFTHSDDDHLAVEQLQYALYPFTSADHAGFTIFGNERVMEAISRRYPEWPFDLRITSAFEAFDFAEYRITPIRANHSADEECHNLLFERGGVKLLYATDTGVYDEETFEFLQGARIDALVLECTDGRRHGTYAGHLDEERFLGVVSRLKGSGALRPGARVITTHHSAQGAATFAELQADLQPHGVEVGFDGMCVTLESR